MSVWHSIFLQDFHDHNLWNFNAVPGHLVTSPEPPAISGDPTQGLGASLSPGHWYRFATEAPITGIVGVNIALRVHIPVTSAQNFNDPITLVSIGDQLRLSAQFRLPLEATDTTAMGSLRFRVGGSTFEWTSFPIDRLRHTQLRVNWYTNGQVKLSASDIVAGDLSLSATTLPGSHYRLTFLHIRLLREHDALRDLATLLSLNLPNDPRLEQCTLLIRARHLAILDRIRAFMTRFSQMTTNTWQAGDAGTPFSAAAVDMHRLAKEALLAFLQFLEAPEKGDANECLDKFRKFFDLLRMHAPDDWNAMLNELGQVPLVSPECRSLAEAMIAANQPQLAPLLHLIEAIAELATIGGDGG
jgi:hypothetical protein